MARKTNTIKNGNSYYRKTKTVGHRMNEAGNLEPIRKEFYGKSMAEAEAKLQAFLDMQNKGLEGKTQYFGIMAENWIYDFFIHDSSIKESTKNLYITTWNKYIKPSKIYGMPLDKVTASSVQKIYNSISSDSAVNTINKLMNRFYKYLLSEGFVLRNITASLSIRKKRIEEEKEITVWSEEELDTIFGNFEKAQEGFRLRFLLVLARYTGCRISELLGLQYNDIVEESGTMVLKIRRQVVETPSFSRNEKITYEQSVGELKSSSSYRTIPLNSIVLEELHLHKHWHNIEKMEKGYRVPFIFTTSSGKLYNDKNVGTACNRYYKRIGVKPKGFHTYRHTFASMLSNNGVQIQTTAELLGHSDISITAKYYVNVSLDKKAEAVKLLENAI